MPQRPTHRLNLYLVPADPESSPSREDCKAALTSLSALGVLSGRRPGPNASQLVEGGFALLRLDEHGERTLYGNRQGGFHVLCPRHKKSVAREFSAAVGAWQRGGHRTLRCPVCNDLHGLEGLRFRPPAALARFAIELRDVQSPVLTADGRAWLKPLLGRGFLVIASRG